MKRILTIVLIMSMLIGGLFVLTGCNDNNKKTGTKEEHSISGKFYGTYSKFVGDPDSEKKDIENYSLVLNADGTGVHNRDDASFNITWSNEGKKFTMRETYFGSSIDYFGTIEGNTLDIYNGDPNEGTTCEYVYENR